MIQYNIDISSLMKYFKDKLKKPDPFNPVAYMGNSFTLSSKSSWYNTTFYFIINKIFQIKFKESL